MAVRARDHDHRIPVGLLPGLDGTGQPLLDPGQELVKDFRVGHYDGVRSIFCCSFTMASRTASGRGGQPGMNTSTGTI